MLPTVTVDVGTTAIKTSYFDEAGVVVAHRRIATPVAHDDAGEIYDLPAMTGFVDGFLRGLDPAARRGLQRIALTGVGESGGLVGADLAPRSPMIVWHDQRGRSVLELLRPEARGEIGAITGLPVHPNYGLAKAAWALDVLGAGSARAADVRWLNIVEYLAARWTGLRWAEYSLASRTMGLDLAARTWSTRVCDLLGIDPAVLPELHAASEGRPLASRISDDLGLGPDVRVHVAGHDHMVGAVGAALVPGELLNSTGTTEGLLALESQPGAYDPATQVAGGVASSGTGFTRFASIPTGGSAFATLSSMLGADAERLSSLVSTAHDAWTHDAVDLDRLPVVLPRFRGSPPPTKSTRPSGVVAGIRTDTTDLDLVHGCFLGLALQFAEVLELFVAAPSTIKVIGPAAANPLWMQVKADLLGRELSAASVGEVVSVGARILAGSDGAGATGEWAALAPAQAHPDATRTERITQWRTTVRPLWEHLKAAP